MFGNVLRKLCMGQAKFRISHFLPNHKDYFTKKTNRCTRSRLVRLSHDCVTPELLNLLQNNSLLFELQEMEKVELLKSNS